MMENRSVITPADLNSALDELTFQSPDWYRVHYGGTCRLFIESPVSRQFVSTTLDYLVGMQRTGQDFSVPMVILAATMLQIGYQLGRKCAETEILDGWMRL